MNSFLFRIAPVIAIGVVAALVPSASTGAASTTDDRLITAHVLDVTGVDLGTLILTPTGSGKLVVVGRFSGLTPGFHGFHIHAVGKCEAPFTTAGPHLNPAGAPHGNHAGDLPALTVAADGRAFAAVETGSATLSDIFDADGSAIVIHAAADNLANIPARYSAAGVPGPDAATLATGDSGARVGCGVITR